MPVVGVVKGWGKTGTKTASKPDTSVGDSLFKRKEKFSILDVFMGRKNSLNFGLNLKIDLPALSKTANLICLGVAGIYILWIAKSIPTGEWAQNLKYGTSVLQSSLMGIFAGIISKYLSQKYELLYALYFPSYSVVLPCVKSIFVIGLLFVAYVTSPLEFIVSLYVGYFLVISFEVKVGED